MCELIAIAVVSDVERPSRNTPIERLGVVGRRQRQSGETMQAGRQASDQSEGGARGEAPSTEAGSHMQTKLL